MQLNTSLWCEDCQKAFEIEQSLGRHQLVKHSMYYRFRSVKDILKLSLHFIQQSSLVFSILQRLVQGYFKIVWGLVYHSPVRPLQNMHHFKQLINFLSTRKMHTILEIGTMYGGSAYLFLSAATNNARLLTVDFRKQCLQDFLQRIIKKTQTLKFLQANSRSPQTVQAVKQFFPNGVDVLFIDGDHSYDGARADFDNYSKLVRPSGIIVFDDIQMPSGHKRTIGHFWEELKHKYKHEEFVLPRSSSSYGIGLIILSANKNACD